MAYRGEMHYLTIGDDTYKLPSSGGNGTVTSVGVANATNGGLSVSGSPITSSGTITIGHSNVLSSAQTTQAVYPIKIDKNGHISAYGSAVTIPSNIVNTITTTAGVHTTISSQKGDVSFNVPTKTSHLTNDSGFITNAGVTGVKGNAESSYRTGQVNLTYTNVGAIGSRINGNTQELYRPIQLNGCNDNTLDQKISFLRANRLLFLPADQIIIEKTTDGGTTWVDAGYTDAQKRHLFSETQGAGISVPLLNGARNANCGLRITITGMKYNVPAGTTETNKYNYWNSNYVLSMERYCQLKEMYFWASTANGGLSCKVERATGSASTNWVQVYDSGSTFALTGWSGNDYIRFTQGVFGGGTTQTGNYWNYRFTFFQRSSTGTTTLPDTYTTSAGTLYEIRGYGDTDWSTTAVSHQFIKNDHIYKWDIDKNVTFPAQITATQFNGTLNGNATSANSATVAGKISDLNNVDAASSTDTWRKVWISYADGVTGRPALTDSLVFQTSTGTLKATAFNGNLTGNVTGNVSGSAGSVPWSGVSSKPTATGSATTGITASTTATKTTLGTANSVTGVQSSTTTASKVTLGTAISIYGVKSGTNSTTTASKASGGNGSASNWVFEDVSCDDITNWAAGSGSFTQGSFTGGSIVVNNHVMSFTPATHGADSHSHTAPTLSYSAKTGSHVKSGGNGTAPTWSFTDVTVPIRADSATSIPNVTAATDVTVPIKNTSSTSIPNVSVTSATVSITDNGHTHSI